HILHYKIDTYIYFTYNYATMRISVKAVAKKIVKFFCACVILTSLIPLFTTEQPVTAEKQPTPKNFSVYMNGRISRFTSTLDRVGDALRENGIIFNKNAMFPKASATLLDGTQIYILKRGEKFEFKEFAKAEIPVEYMDDPELEYGTETVMQSGYPGIDKVIYKISAEGEQTEIGRIHKILPQKSVIKRGTKDCIMTENGLKHYNRKFIANVSAYTIEDGNGDGVTSIGIVPYEGVVAVDPEFIPYHSKLFIPGYGLAVAADTGGAIEGNCIDLFMYDRDRAWEWGRRYIEVYVLDD
ncbi:MAG: G5 domain-containing protein, partial [Phascolarctobacterium sp.]|nr:G5 domain-containing protein [Candidatus Phascolarctobacterium caballi]